MSLLIQALKEAERKNKLAAQQAANVDVEMPPAAAPAPPEGSRSSASPHREESSLSLEIAEAEPAHEDFPSLHAPDDVSVSEPLEMDSLPVSFDDDEQTSEREARLPGVPDLPTPEDFPRQGEPMAFEPTHEKAAPVPASTEQEDPTPLVADGAEPAPYLVPASDSASRSALHSARGKWVLSAAVIAIIASGVLWSPLVLTPGNPTTVIPPDFPVADMDAPTISPTGAYTDTVGVVMPEVPSSLQVAAATPMEKDLTATPADSSEPAVAITDPVTPPPIAASPPATNSSASAAPTTTKVIVSELQEPSPPRSAAVTPAVASPAAAPAMPAVRFVRAKPTHEQAGDLLNRGYEALRAQRYIEANTAYRSALRMDRNLIDGWIGLASIASHQGNPTLAEQYYRRALQIDPNDVIARSGLLSLGGASLAQQAESTLRTLATNPISQSTAQLTLGNTLAAQGQWREAQQAYFNANAAMPDRPDVLFNLAVALERIHQPGPALQYYERALARSKGNTVMFDPAIARQRIDALTAAQVR